MLRTIVRLTPTLSFSLFTSKNEMDADMLRRPIISKEQTGWDRVKAMYSKDDHGEVSKELHTVVQSSLSGAFIGSCFGGFIRSREAYLYFIENNQATIFTSTLEAKKKLQDFVTVAFAKGAYKWGWKLAIFTGMFSLTATTISVYRGDTSLAEYIIAGAITGSLYKANLGLAATFVGATLGAILSTVGGVAILGLLKITGVTMNDIRTSLYRIKEERQDQMNQALEKSAKIKHDDLTRHHEQLVNEKGRETVEQMVK